MTAPLNALGQPVRPAWARIPEGIATCADYERHAVHHVEAHAWHHIQGGSDQGLTLAHNRAAFDRLQLLPHPIASLRGAPEDALSPSPLALAIKSGDAPWTSLEIQGAEKFPGLQSSDGEKR